MRQVTMDRLRGVAVGAAVGDALGMPLEFGPAIPVDELVWEMTGGRMAAGSFTDDTEMALALAESLLRANPLDPADLAQCFVAWYQAGPPDVGIHTGHVLGLIAKGMPWLQASRQVHTAQPSSASNGSVMRCWPVAIRDWNNREQLLQESRLQSEVTHRHPDCLSACQFINVLISELVLAGDEKTAKERLSSAFEAALDQVNISKEFLAVVKSAQGKQRDQLVNSGWVQHTLESTIWALFNFEGFEETLVQVANLGGDADTTAAVTGAVAGALYGFTGIPIRWTEVLHGEYPLGSGRIWLVEDLIELADRLAGQGT